MSEVKLIHIDPETGNVKAGSKLYKLQEKIEKDIRKFLNSGTEKCSNLELKLIIQALQQEFWDSVINYQLFDRDKKQ